MVTSSEALCIKIMTHPQVFGLESSPILAAHPLYDPIPQSDLIPEISSPEYQISGKSVKRVRCYRYSSLGPRVFHNNRRRLGLN